MKLIIGNQKAYLDSNQINEFIKGSCNIENNNNIIICPSSIYIERFKTTNFLLGSQNISNYPSGSSTGELSAEQLKSVGIKFAIVGHSERRQTQHETNEEINIKIKQLLKYDITPILCVGESKINRESKKYKEVILTEINEALNDLSTDSVDKIIIAYEPIWSIGTGIIPTNEQIDEMSKYIKEIIKKDYNCDMKVLYGGSVNDNNVGTLNKITSVDGYLIGGASTKIEEFKKIIERCQ